jgi:hypothetical protein
LHRVRPEEVAMVKLAFAGIVLLALTSVPATAGPQAGNRNASRGVPPAKTVSAASTDAIRGRVVDVQQTLDRILADTTPAPVGTSGGGKVTATDVQTAGSPAVTIDRDRLLQLRRQLDALLATLK